MLICVLLFFSLHIVTAIAPTNSCNYSKNTNFILITIFYLYTLEALKFFHIYYIIVIT